MRKSRSGICTDSPFRTLCNQRRCSRRSQSTALQRDCFPTRPHAGLDVAAVAVRRRRVAIPGIGGFMAQAMRDGFTVVTLDPVFRDYGAPVFW